MKYKIDKNVPIPKSRLRKIWPLADLKPGDSFLIPIGERSYLSQAIAQQKRRTNREFTTRKISDTEVRVWRVK